MMAPDTTLGSVSGQVTCRNVAAGLAPRSAEASSSARCEMGIRDRKRGALANVLYLI